MTSSPSSKQWAKAMKGTLFKFYAKDPMSATGLLPLPSVFAFASASASALRFGLGFGLSSSWSCAGAADEDPRTGRDFDG